MPSPLVGGAIGVAPPAGCDCDAGLMIELRLRSYHGCQDRNRLVRKKPTARTAVVRVSKLAVPRLDIKPAPPPTPRPPPSDFCNSTVAISVATIMRWITITTVCISNLPSQTKSAGIRQHLEPAVFEVARCYTIAWGIVTPGSMVAPAPLAVN